LSKTLSFALYSAARRSVRARPSNGPHDLQPSPTAHGSASQLSHGIGESVVRLGLAFAFMLFASLSNAANLSATAARSSSKRAAQDFSFVRPSLDAPQVLD